MINFPTSLQPCHIFPASPGDENTARCRLALENFSFQVPLGTPAFVQLLGVTWVASVYPLREAPFGDSSSVFLDPRVVAPVGAFAGLQDGTELPVSVWRSLRGKDKDFAARYSSGSMGTLRFRLSSAGILVFLLDLFPSSAVWFSSENLSCPSCLFLFVL